MMDDASVFDGDDVAGGDSAIGIGSMPPPGALRLYEMGPVTVVGFGGVDVPDEVCVAGYRDQLFQLIEDQDVEVLAFDMSGVALVPSGMLGLLVSIKQRGVHVQIFNPSEQLREALAITHLEPMFEICEVDVP